ncbi:SRPBCC family protein [Nocardioides donggukensis]|uniref:Carbon monoxide dehydrogenase subunit G n=1 Tax=Nocardioides donggukensis TaxID=2774019 RepID=A0A927K1J9_9ACTN|nr:carbon monoxide dehydrogenase subunit G [Nocardioides donggukensis]MBD8868617.1 carbon monoxide dehydrogenase subunit G [Nocardioides donggukensis]
MIIAGEHTLNAPVERVWGALLDPQVLVGTIPGCTRLEATAENSYAMTVSAGVAAIKGTYDGTCVLSDLVEHESLTMAVQGAGAPGTIGADVAVSFADNGDGTTRLTYTADAVVGGMIGGVGQRMLTSVSRRMAAEFFGNVEGVLSGAAPAVPAMTSGASGTPGAAPDSAAGAAPAAGQVFTRPAAAGGGGPEEFLKGIAVGAGLVLLGVLAGRIGRR